MDNRRVTSKVPCKACPHFWPAPRVDLFVGRCGLQRRWLLAEQKCVSLFVEREGRKQKFRKETRA